MNYPDKAALVLLENGLIERFKGGDQSAFAGLVELYKDRIHQFILCILGPDRESEDIAQEAFIQIYRSLPSFRGGSSFSTWAYAVTRNVCRHRLRTRVSGADALKEAEEEARRIIPGHGPAMELALETEETKALVRAQIAALSPVHQAVLFLSCWEKLSYAEMAEILEVPVGTVRSRLHNALSALSGRLKTALAEEEQT